MADKSNSSTPPVTPAIKATVIKEISLPTAVLALDADTEGKRLFAACFDGGVYEIDIASGKNRQIGKHQSYASGVQFLRSKNQLISAGYDGHLIWHDVALNDPTLKGAGASRPVRGQDAPAPSSVVEFGAVNGPGVSLPVQADRNQPLRTVAAHKFWSWQLHLSQNEQWVASATGQYLAGGYKYEPATESEPGIKVYNTQTGELRWSLTHVPPVLSVAFSPDSRFLAAGNMMGETRVWDLESGKLAGTCATPGFTSWGVVKSHHYIGGIFDLVFTPDSSEVLLCGMGPMGDPMAGNGKQTWMRFNWRDGKQVGRSKDGDTGNGLMETIQFHPTLPYFVMAGRLAQGKWNVAFFEFPSGKMLDSMDNKMRVTDSVFYGDGSNLALAGAISQERRKDGKCPDFGKVKIYKV